MIAKGNWKKTSIGDVVREVKDEINRNDNPFEFYVAGEHMETETLHIRQKGTFGIDYVGPAFKRIFRKRQVLYGSRRTYLKKIAVADFDGITSNTTFVLETKSEENLLQDLLPFILLSDDFTQHSIQKSRGSVNPYIVFSDIAKFEFLLPSINEQKRIAELLWAAEKQIVSLEVVVENMRILRNTYFRYTQNEEFLKEEKKQYRLLSIEDSYDILNNLRRPISASERSSIQGKYPYYGPTGILDYINEYRVDGEYVLIGEDGDHFLKYETWNMTQLINGKNNVNNHAHILKGKNGNLTKWFYYYFKHRDITKYLSKQGSGRLKLNKSTLQKMKIVIPSTGTQEYLCNQYDEIENALTDSINNLNDAKNILNSLIRFFFGGATNV